jgi:hypothetical protein
MVVVEVLESRAQDLENPSPNYPGQRMYLVHLSGYPHLVPYEENEQETRLITIIPDRRYK